jgi:hypothetical protein
MTDHVLEAAKTIARFCGRTEPDASDYRAVANGAFHEMNRLRGLLREARKDLQGWMDDTKSDGYESKATEALVARIDAAISNTPTE